MAALKTQLLHYRPICCITDQIFATYVGMMMMMVMMMSISPFGQVGCGLAAL
jgi:hypothetical protein